MSAWSARLGVEVSGPAGLATGSHVDVLVYDWSGAGGGRTLVALAGAELLRLQARRRRRRIARRCQPHAADRASATLRVTSATVYLTTADNFAAVRRARPPPGGTTLHRHHGHQARL